MSEETTAVETPVETPPETTENVFSTDTTPPQEVKNPLDTQATEPAGAPDINWLPEDLRENERFKGIESPEALARAFAEAELMQALPDTYQLPQGAPEQLGKWAKDNGLSQQQLDSMLGLQQQMATFSETAKHNVYAQGREALFQSWGENKEANLKTAEAVFQAVPSGPKLAQFIKATGEGANPVVIQFLHEVGSFLSEGGFLKSGGPRNEVKKDPLKARYPTMFPKDEE